MDIIMNYIDSMFAGIPVTDETSRLREDITANMTDKYDELVKEGKSGNEAIGTVISEFGSIDEVLSEMGITRGAVPVVITEAPEKKYLSHIRTVSLLAAAGAGILILGIALMFVLQYHTYEKVVSLFTIFAGIVFIFLSLFIRVGFRQKYTEISEKAVTVLKSKYEAGRSLTLKMVFPFICIFAVLFALFSGVRNFDMFSLIFMISVSLNLAVTAFVYTEKRTLAGMIGVTVPRLKAADILRELTLPYFMCVLMSVTTGYNQFEIVVIAVVVYVIMHLCVGLFDTIRENAK